MTKVVISIPKATENGLYKTLSDPNIPMFKWLRENIGEIYGDKDFYQYWRGINWHISGIDQTHFSVIFASSVSEDLITLFRLRWL